MEKQELLRSHRGMTRYLIGFPIVVFLVALLVLALGSPSSCAGPFIMFMIIGVSGVFFFHFTLTCPRCGHRLGAQLRRLPNYCPKCGIALRD